ncbi:apolipoprotein A-I-like [Cheilinus undulatus]|uniref:apolipoprotein A-I-like n=1 Tax=Cheilinus undulatus TaxID=241271 RepID=UPI001BD2DB62|nr:apolipoprotein A-I-like [Cheilinus undulatus]
MKYLSLALALLLAVGSQTAPMPTDDVSTALNHVRRVMDDILSEIEVQFQKALEGVEDPNQRSLLGGKIQERFRMIRQDLGAVQSQTDGALEATRDMRQAVTQQFKSLADDLRPKLLHLKEVVDRHMDEYRSILEPIAQDYNARRTTEMENLRAQMEPIIERLASNIEETKSALMPIVEFVSAKGHEWLQNLREAASPYIEEYRDQIMGGMRNARHQARNINTEDLSTLRDNVIPKANQVITKVKEIFSDIASTINKA